MINRETTETVKIFIDLKPIDWMAFNQIYTPILGLEIANIYSTIYYQKSIFNHLSVADYKYETLLNNLNTDAQKFKSQLRELEKLNLLKVSIKHKTDSSVDYLIQLFAPLSINLALENQEIALRFKEVVTQEKRLEIALLTENKDLGYDLELSNSEELEETWGSNKPNICNKELWFDFYDYLFKDTGKHLSVDDRILELIKIYHEEQKIISLDKLKVFATQSIKQKDKSWFICVDNMNELINNEIDKKPVVVDQHHEFWQQLMNLPEKTALKKFHALFSNIETTRFYEQIYNKQKTPVAFDKWVIDCLQNKNFSFSALNACISFVKSLLGKIPVNYLIKLSATIFDEDLLKPEAFLQHFRSVITHDFKNLNRLKINLEILNKNREDNIFSTFLNN